MYRYKSQSIARSIYQEPFAVNGTNFGDGSISGRTGTIGEERKDRRRIHALTDRLTQSQPRGDRSTDPMCVCRLYWTEVSLAAGRQQTLAGYGVSGGRGAAVAVLAVPAHLSGLAAGNDAAPNLATRQRLGCDAVSAGVRVMERPP